jgi:hypothetical protein
MTAEDRLRQPECEGCDGSGVRTPAEPSCRFSADEVSGWVIVERCDICERYRDDLVAAAAQFRRVRWVFCTDGGHHAVGQM